MHYRRNKSASRILTLMLAFLMFVSVLPVFSFAGQTTGYGQAAALTSADYVLVLKGITPSGMSKGDYYLSSDPANNPGMKFGVYDTAAQAMASRWQITRISDTKCTIRNAARGDNGYLNLSSTALSYGSYQELEYEFSGLNCCFFSTIGGMRYYIRFTNGGTTNEPRFHSGSGNSSNYFALYVSAVYETTDMAGSALPDGDPLLTLACISDLHADYGLQSQAPYIRNSVITTCEAIKSTENADILLVGGDMTSDNAQLAKNGGWKYDTFSKVISKYDTVMTPVTDSGYTLYCAGNHDYQAGAYDNYDAYEDFVTLMATRCGTPLSVYYQKDDTTLADQTYPDHVLGIHYFLKGFDFILLNAPYSKSQTYSSGTLQWLSQRLAAIGADRTVFLLTHFPLQGSNGLSTQSYGIGSDYAAMTAILRQYPKLIYLYGHNHGGSEQVYISNDTFERITPYGASGESLTDRSIVPASFVSAFMGSMSYYDYSLNPDGLKAEDPEIVQALMVYVYADRIVFQMKNYGDKYVSETLQPWTLMRDVASETEVSDLCFRTASLTLQDNLALNFKVPQTVLDSLGCTDPYAEFQIADRTYTVRDKKISDGNVVFTFHDIPPQLTNDPIKATLCGTISGLPVKGKEMSYSIAEYCYSLLGTTSNAYLRTLVVDLLNYATAAQNYSGHSTDAPANGALTPTQAAWGTDTTMTPSALTSVFDPAYATVTSPSVNWLSVGLQLKDTVAIRVKIPEIDLTGVTVKVSVPKSSYSSYPSDRLWEIDSSEFVPTEGGYYVYFREMCAGEMSAPVYFTVMKNGVAVSNTLRYSIESYVCQASSYVSLQPLVYSMIRFGRSAAKYIESSSWSVVVK